MLKITDLYGLALALLLTVPGFVLLSIRNYFIVNKTLSSDINFLRYIVATAFSYAFSSGFIYFLLYNDYVVAHGAVSAFLWFVVLFINPVFLGVSWVLITKSGLLRTIMSKCGLDMIHESPTGWDWQFGRIKTPHWVLVTLIDGSQIAGLYGKTSLASSEIGSRDLYLEQIYKIVDDQPWERVCDSAGIYICHGQIRTVEFWSQN